MYKKMYKNFDLEQLEQEYSPSSCIDDITVFINQYINFSAEATKKALSEHSVMTDLSYGESNDELLDLYLPTQGNNKKLQVYIHGGYWQELSKAESSFAATNFQQHGCYFAVINYSLAPDASVSEIVEQNRRAIAWLYTNAELLGFDANEIYLSGSSAGGHLAMMMLQTMWRDYIPKLAENQIIKGICAVSGVYDLTPIARTYINEPLQLTPLEIQQNSPIDKVLVNKCPVILAFGEQETREFKRQTSEMAMQLTLTGAEISCNEISKRNHFDVILDLKDPNSWLSLQVFRQMNITP